MMMMRLHTLLVALIACGFAAPTLVGCGSDADAEDNQQQNDDQWIDADGMHVHVQMSPTRHIYDVDTSVTPSATVYRHDDEIEDAEVDWSVSPADAVDEDDGEFTLRKAAHITFVACVVDGDSTTDDCGERTIVASGDHSEVVIESPAPGEHFDGSDDPTIPVEGSVHEDVAAASVQVNGEPAELDDDGSFSHDLDPEFGINPVEVRVFDGITDEDHVARTNAMWAPEYRHNHSSDSIGGGFTDALLINLAQRFFDDGEPYYEISDSEVITEDLADMLELLLVHLDINDEIPDPVVDTDTLQLAVPDVVPGEPVVEIDTTDDGIEIYGQLPELSADTEGELALSDETVSLDGDISATISLFAAIDVDKPGPDDGFEVEMTDFDLILEQAEPNFEDESADAVFELADSMLRGELEDIILDSIDISFIDNLDDIVLDMLVSLDEALADHSFDLDLEFGPAVDIDFEGRVGELTTIFGEGLTGSVDAHASVNSSPLHPDNPGVPVYEPKDAQSPLLAGNRVQIGIDLTVLNALLHALWNAGFLNLDITDLVPDNVSGLIEEGETEALIPPMILPPEDDRDDDLILQIAQFELELDWMDQTDRFGVNAEMGANLEVVGDDVMIDLSDDPELDLWLIETDEDEPLMEPHEVRDILEAIILPELDEQIGENLTFSLPLPELDILEDYAPALADMSLDVRMNRSPHMRGGYMMIDATLEGEYLLD